jgi:PAS domain S-box-containing protein
MTTSQPASALYRPPRWALVGVVVIVLVTPMLAVLAYRVLDELSIHRRAQEFTHAADARHALVQERLRGYREAIWGIRQLFQQASPVTEEQFTAAATAVATRHPSISSLEYAPVIDQTSFAIYEQRMRARWPDFAVREQNEARALVPAGRDRERYAPLTYFYPSKPEEPARGLDIFKACAPSDLRRAESSQDLVMSNVVTLARDTASGQKSVLFILPILGIAGNTTPEAAADGTITRRPITGYVQLAFRLDDIFAVSDARAMTDTLQIRLYNFYQQQADRLKLWETHLNHPPAQAPATDNLVASYRREETLSFGGRVWYLEYLPNPVWLRQQYGFAPLAAALGLALLGTLCATFVHSLHARQRVILREVERRTRELHDQRGMLDAIVDHNPNAIWAKDRAGRFLLVNETFARLCGWPAAELIGGQSSDLLPDTEIASLREHDEHVLRTGETRLAEVNITLQGKRHTLHTSKFPLSDATGQIYALAGVATDLTDRRQAEEALAASEERYRAFITHSLDAIWRSELPSPLPEGLSEDATIDHLCAEARLAECNDTFARMYGFASAQEIIGLRLNAILNPQDPRNRDYLRAFIRNDYRLQDYESHEVDRHGQPRVFANTIIGLRQNGRLIRVWGTQRDITTLRAAESEKRKLERKLQETQKLESLGVLAGGIAHDFNNLLTGILGNAGLLRDHVPAGDAGHSLIDQLEQASLRAAELCRQMLAYSGRGRFDVRPIEFSALVRDTVPLLRLSIAKTARLHYDLAHELPNVVADPTQIRQIVMNLVMNASEALGPKGGDVTVRTGLRHANASYFTTCVLSPDLAPGDYPFIEVSDNGCGMSPEVLARIFDPFFSTKFAGRGLGLAAALGIVRGHEGALHVRSTLGEGSTFRLLLPANSCNIEPALSAHTNAGTVPLSAPLGSASGIAPHSQGEVLVVDDEDLVRDLATKSLTRMGHTVTAAPDGDAARRIFAENPDRYRFALVDLTMPGLPGDLLVSELRKLSPQLPVIVMSGYATGEISARFADLQPIEFLPKPFEQEQLRQAVARALG